MEQDKGWWLYRESTLLMDKAYYALNEYSILFAIFHATSEN